jgi:hypothetical protein
MRHLLFVWIVVLSQSVPGCNEIMKQLPSSSGGSITNQEIVEGLKTALLVGTDSSVSTTSRINGFYKDQAIKILLPPEAEIIYQNKNNALFKAAGLDKKLEEAVMALNRAAEDASKEAGPIFKNSIKNLSIAEGFSILRGKNPASPVKTESFDSTAATGYLKYTTYDELSAAFSPIVNTSLNKSLIGNLSPNQIWGSLTSSYNAVASKSFGLIDPMVTTDLGVYVTERALDGLFYKVAVEEKKIRKDPFQWARTSVGPILQKVFGN